MKTFINTLKGVQIGMRANDLAAVNRTTIWERSIIGAVSLANKRIPDHVKAVDIPAKVKD